MTLLDPPSHLMTNAILTPLLKCCLNCYIYVWLSWPSSHAVFSLCIQVPDTDSRSTFFKLCFLFGSADRQSASVRLGTWPESPTVSYNVNHIPQQHVALFMRELNVCQAYTRLSQRCVNQNTTLKYLCINHADHFFQFEIKSPLVNSFRFIWIPMLWVHGHTKCFN